MAHESLYDRHSSYDPTKPWANSFQADIRDNRDPEDIGNRILKVRVFSAANPLKKLKTHELHDLLEEGRRQ